ncbi:hypothetical protein F2P81_022938 [Scophthalmus maximus]|uniref:Secreted protein n=1 Tax=Scophthalmus maximus TaxID=52904 RepID=A0A6A4RNM7_SCOMX|nr:hypothetical protein F2P81_022938 [Scophthalmus maximus]
MRTRLLRRCLLTVLLLIRADEGGRRSAEVDGGRCDPRSPGGRRRRRGSSVTGCDPTLHTDTTLLLLILRKQKKNKTSATERSRLPSSQTTLEPLPLET